MDFLDLMKKDGCLPSKSTFYQLFLLCNNAQEVNQILELMKNESVEPSEGILDLINRKLSSF